MANPNSVRSQLRLALLVSMSARFGSVSHGTLDDIETTMKRLGATRGQKKARLEAVVAPKNVGIQMSQVRNELCEVLKLGLPERGRGPMRPDFIAEMHRKLSLKSVQKRIDDILADYEAEGVDLSKIAA